MISLLLLLLVGATCAQEPGDPLHTDDGDDELVDLSNQEDKDDMPDGLETTPVNEFEIQEEPGDPLHTDDGDDELVDLSNQEDENDMPDDLETTPVNEFEIEEEPGESLHNETDELDDFTGQEDEDGMLDDLETTSDDDLIQPDVTMKIVDGKSKRFGFLRGFTRIFRSFGRAENFCRRRRGDLSSVHSRRINGRMRRMMRRSRKKLAWIGVWKPWRLGKYQNVDQTPMDYNQFGRGQCRKKGRWCVAMNIETGKWCSQDCRKKLPFVCENCKKP